MAPTPPLRTETAQVVSLAGRDLARLWALVAAGANAGEVLHDLLPAIVREYGQVGAVLAAEWYDEQRTKAGAPGRFFATPVAPSDRRAHALVGWALTEATDDEALHALILGGVQRRIADHVRSTISGNSVRDPQAVGWKRIGTGSCQFCRMLIERDELYSKATADFASHDNCLCQAYPLIKGAKPIDVKDYVVSSRRTIDPDTGKPIVDADFERAKKWIADNL